MTEGNGFSLLHVSFYKISTKENSADKFLYSELCAQAHLGGEAGNQQSEMISVAAMAFEAKTMIHTYILNRLTFYFHGIFCLGIEIGQIWILKN